jgi:hypothetical protein
VTNKERELGSGHVTLDDAIDLHVHFGPEPLIARAAGVPHAVTVPQAAEEASRAGMAAIVLKAHEFPSTGFAPMYADSSARVFAGICCDFPVGGLNPVAVETALRAGAKVVWLPTISSHTYESRFHLFGWEGKKGLHVLDENGSLVTEAQEILGLGREHGAVLATGHISRTEHFAVAQSVGSTVPLIVTHALQERSGGPQLSEQDCRELAAYGAYIELTAHTCMDAPASAERIAKAVQSLPQDHVVLSTDFGWSSDLPNPAAGLESYVDSLYEMGAPASALEQMACVNPARVLGIDP